MKHSKIFKREDKSQVRITLSVSIDYIKVYTSINVEQKQFRKRTWTNLIDADSYPYRSLSIEERRKYWIKQAFLVVTKEEIEEVKQELLDLINSKIKFV